MKLPLPITNQSVFAMVANAIPKQLTIAAFIILALVGHAALAQTSLTTANSPSTENFNGMGTSSSANTPGSFRIYTTATPTWSNTNTAVTRAAGTSGSGVLTSSSNSGTYNYADGATGTSTERSLGFLDVSPRSIVAAYTNNTGATVTSVYLEYDYEKLRSGTRAYGWTLAYGTATNSQTNSIAAGTLNYAADGNNTTVSNPPTANNVYATVTGLSIANGSTIYLKWVLTGVGGSSNGQALAIDNFSIVANPVLPTLSSTLTPSAVCSGAGFTYTPTSATSGATYTWTRAAVTGISNAAVMTETAVSTSISETLTNTTASPVTVTYLVTTTNPTTRVRNQQSVSVVVNPTPSLTSSLTPPAVCSGSTFAYTATSATAGATFSWTRAAVAGISNAAVTVSQSGNPSEALVNTTNAPVSVVYAITTTANGCSNTQNVTVSVNPALTPEITGATSFCTGGSTTLTATAGLNNYQWSSNGGTNWTAASATNTLSVSAAGSYIVRSISASSCTSAASAATVVTLNAVPTTLTITAGGATTFNQGGSVTLSTSYVLTAGQSYLWSTGATTSSISVTTGGFYYLNIIHVAGCTSTISNAITVKVWNNPAAPTITPNAACVTSLSAGTVVGNVTTLAGLANTAGLTDGTGSAARFSQPRGILVLPNGDYLITEWGSFRIRRVTPAGVVTHYAGSSTGVFGTDNGSLTASRFNWIEGMVYDSKGTIFLVDRSGRTIRKISPDGIVSVFAGSGASGNADNSNPLLATFAEPIGLAIDGNDNLYVGDIGNGNVRRITPAGVVTTLGSYSAHGLVYDAFSNCLFASNYAGQTVAKITLTGTVTIFAGVNGSVGNTDGTGTAARFSGPAGITVDRSGILYVSDYDGSRIRRITQAGVVTTLSGTAGSGSVNGDFATARFLNPVHPAVDFDGNLMIPDLGSHTIREITLQTTWAWGNSSTASTLPVSALGSYSLTQTNVNGNATTANYTVTAIPVAPAVSIAITTGTNNLCGGTSLTFTATPTNGGSTPSYQWTRNGNNISGATSVTYTGVADLDFVNNDIIRCVMTSNDACRTTATATSAGFTMVVRSLASLNSTLTPAAICNGANFSYTPTSATAGTTFTWTRAAIGGNAAITIPQTSNPSGALVNNTTAPISLVYAYTLTNPNGCIRTQNVTVVVNPTPALSSTLTPTAICNGDNFSYTPTSATAGTTFTWTRAAIGGNAAITTAQASNPSGALVNNTTAPISVVYAYTLTANSCTNTQNVTVVVNPTPALSSTLSPAAICSGSAFIYTATSNNTSPTFTWTRAAIASINSNASAGGSGATIFHGLTNSSASPVTVTYAITTTSIGCTNTQNVTVVVNPTPALSSTLTPSAICNGANFSYTPTSATAGTTFTWTRAAIGGNAAITTAQASNPSGALVNNTTAPIDVVFVYTLTANSCTNTQNVTVRVNPTPALSSTLTPSAICNGANFSYTPTSATAGTTFTWTRAAIGGNAAITTAQASNPSGALVNNTTAPIDVVFVYTLTANSCTNTQNVTVVVNPTPALSSTLTPSAICNGANFSYTPTSATAGTTFTWTRAAIGGNAAITTAQASNPSGALVNNTTAPIDVVYVYTLTANSCTNTQNVTVRVNPTPALSSTLTPTAICNGANFSYTPTSATAGTTFTWTRAAIGGNAAITTAQASNPSGALVNNTTAPIDVVYVYTLTANSCTNTQNVTVRVNPTPALSSTLTPTAICNGANFSYTPTSATAGTTFTWTRAAIGGNAAITTAQASNPSGALVNNTTAPIDVVFVYTLTANSCTNTQNVTVRVNPTPALSSTLTPTAICTGANFSYTPTSATAGTTFTWTRAAIGGNAAITTAQASNPTGALVNNTTAPIDVVYAYTLTANSCTNTQNVTVRVNPTPTLTSGLNPTAICAGANFSYIPTSATAGTTFTWTRAAIGGNAAITTAQASNPSGALVNNTAAPIDVVYVYTLTANGCTNTQNVTVRVNITPTLTSGLNPTAICTGANFSYTPTSATAGTTFTWTRAAIGGNAAITTAQTGNPSGALVNNTTAPIDVVYVYTLTAGSCTNTQNVTVRVNPTPTLTSGLTPTAICAGANFSYTPTSATAGTTFTWTRAAIGGNAAITTAQTGNPSGALVNNTAAPINLVYAYTLTANGCTNTQNVTVVVNPTPATPTLSVSNGANECIGNTISVTNTAGCVGCTYIWNGGGTGSTTTVIAGINEYSVSVRTAAGCTTTTGTITVTSLPAGTWVGASNSWGTTGNWCGGIPTVNSDIVIPAGATNVPMVAGNGVCRSLTLQPNQTLTMTSGSSLTLYGNFTGGGKISGDCNSTVELAGSSLQTMGRADVGRLIVNNASNVTITDQVIVCTSLLIAAGNINAGSSVLTFAPTATKPTETASNRIIGRVRARGRSVGTSTLDMLGVRLAGGVDDLDTVFVERREETATFGTKQGISYVWSIRAANQPVSGRSVQLTWPSSVLNGNTTTGMQMWRRPDNGTTWSKVGTRQRLNPSNGLISMWATTRGFSDWTTSGENNTLPVTWVGVKGQRKDDGSARLTWTVASQVSNRGFVVQRSNDGIRFDSIGFVKGDVNNASLANFGFDDDFRRAAYYRLMQVDLDGTTSLSAAVLINAEVTNQPLSVYPNPASRELYIMGLQDEAKVELYGANGQLQLTQTVFGQAAIDLSTLPVGVYMYRILTVNGQQSGRVVKQ